MAFLTAIMSLVSKQMSSLLQAVFGWSVTTLFGKLPSKQRTALSAVILMAVLWPILVVGAFLPDVAAWAIAFVPLESYVPRLVLRVVWISLAAIVPLAVGAIVWWIAPEGKRRTPLPVTMLGGYPMTLGYALAFVVTAITYPIVKILSAVRKWDDTHVFVEPKEGRYHAVLDALTDACARANVEVTREDVPRQLALATSVTRLFSSPFISPSNEETLQRLRGEGIELYLYPADLLLRGDANKVARTRAAMTRTELPRDAYLVSSDEGRQLQDDIARLAPFERAARAGDARDDALLLGRVRRVSARLDRASIPFDEWSALGAQLRRLELAALGEEGEIERADRARSGARRGRREWLATRERTVSFH